MTIKTLSAVVSNLFVPAPPLKKEIWWPLLYQPFCTCAPLKKIIGPPPTRARLQTRKRDISFQEEYGWDVLAFVPEKFAARIVDYVYS